MKHIITIGIAVFFSILQLNAQSDFRDGYIVKNNNDTVFGLIDYNRNKTNAKKCTFKEINSEIQVFKSDEIKSFQFINGKYFISKKVESDGIATTVFLEYLINGKVDIYYLHSLDKYYLEKDDKLYELKNSIETISKNSFLYEQKKKEYIGIMTYLLQDANITNDINKAELDHKSLIKIAKEYHSQVCKDEECVVYEKKISKVTSKFGIVVGLNGMSIIQKREFTEELYYLINSQFGFTIYPSIGIYYKVKMPGENERLFFQYEGTYSHVNLKSSHSYIDPLYNMNFLNDIHWTQNIFNNLAIIKYEFPKGKIRPTFQIGGFIRYSFQTNYTKNLKVMNSLGSINDTDQTNDSPFSKFDYGMNYGVGLTSLYRNNKEFFLDIRYQRGYGLLPNLNTNTFLINIGFQLGK